MTGARLLPTRGLAQPVALNGEPRIGCLVLRGPNVEWLRPTGATLAEILSATDFDGFSEK